MYHLAISGGGTLVIDLQAGDEDLLVNFWALTKSITETHEAGARRGRYRHTLLYLQITVWRATEHHEMKRVVLWVHTSV